MCPCSLLQSAELMAGPSLVYNVCNENTRKLNYLHSPHKTGWPDFQIKEKRVQTLIYILHSLVMTNHDDHSSS